MDLAFARFLSGFGTRLGARLSRFGSNESGNGAVLFGLALMPVAAAIGTSIDYREALRMRQTLETALERVADDLFETRAIHSARELQQRANLRFAETLEPHPQLAALGLRFRQIDRSIELSSSGHFQTRFLSAVGIDTLPISATALIRPRPRHVDILLAYDTSETAALAPELEPIAARTSAVSRQLDTRVRVGLVPYTDVVRVDPDRFRDRSWLAFRMPGKPQTERGKKANLNPQVQWQGCLASRDRDFAGSLKRAERSRPGSFHPAVDCADRDIPAATPVSAQWKPMAAAPVQKVARGCADPALALRLAISSLSRDDVLGSDPRHHIYMEPEREVHIVVALPKSTSACPAAHHVEALNSLCTDSARRYGADRRNALRITFVPGDTGGTGSQTCGAAQPVARDGKVDVSNVPETLQAILDGRIIAASAR
jgi:hypothetical protein